MGVYILPILKKTNKLQYLERKPINLSWFSCGPSILVELEFSNVGFSGGWKTGESGEKPSEQGREPTTNLTHVWHLARGIKPGI